MTTISNNTRGPLRVPLPGGKKLHLGFGKTAEVSPKALEHPPLKKLIDAGEVEVVSGSRKRGDAAGGRSSGAPRSHRGGGGIRHTGDR